MRFPFFEGRSLSTLVAGFAALLAVSGCVAISEEVAQKSESILATRPDFEPLDPGAYTHETLHFSIKGYGREKVKAVSRLAEELYQKIMDDTGLYSFRPKNLYSILIYGERQEYIQKTGMPDWSAGATIGNALCTFEHPHWETTIAHEMSHLIFNEYLGWRAPRFVWLNEGLAMYQEKKALGDSGRRVFISKSGPAVARLQIPFAQMVEMVPATERERDINQWYLQVESVVRFLIEKGGRLGFSVMLRSLKEGVPLDEAIGKGFPGRWNSIEDLEQSWRGFARGR